jgi:hypothetical protein
MANGKCIPVWLDRETYQRFEQVAHAYERVPEQQVRWMIRQALEDPQRAAAEAVAAQETNAPQ